MDVNGIKYPFVRWIQAFLAISVTLGFFGVIIGLMFIPIPETTKDILLVMLGALLASYKELTGYFFGSSSSSDAKDTALASAANTPSQRPTVTITPAEPSMLRTVVGERRATPEPASSPVNPASTPDDIGPKAILTVQSTVSKEEP